MTYEECLKAIDEAHATSEKWLLAELDKAFETKNIKLANEIKSIRDTLYIFDHMKKNLGVAQEAIQGRMPDEDE